MAYERDNIAAMAGYSYGEQPAAPRTIKLNTNENPYPPSPAVAEVTFVEHRIQPNTRPIGRERVLAVSFDDEAGDPGAVETNQLFDLDCGVPTSHRHDVEWPSGMVADVVRRRQRDVHQPTLQPIPVGATARRWRGSPKPTVAKILDKL